MASVNKPLTLDINDAKLYNKKDILFHGYIYPFAVLYSAWIGVLIHLGFANYYELAIIGVVIIALCQIVTALFCYWSIAVRCLLMCTPQESVYLAELVRVNPTPNNGVAVIVPMLRSVHPETKEKIYYFYFQRLKYVFTGEKVESLQPTHFPIDLEFKHYFESKGIENQKDLNTSIIKYGVNELELTVPPFIELFLERATAPFFVFQVFCVVLWCLDEYWVYPIMTLGMLVIFEATLVFQQLKNMTHIRSMSAKPYKILTYRFRKWQLVNSSELVPGDLVSITDASVKSRVIPCDLLLVRGACIVDESMLTGESVPVTKEACEEVFKPHERFTFEQSHKAQVLFGGTKVVQHTSPDKTSPIKATDNGCVCYVLRTGLSTSQGRLLKTIMYSVKTVTANNRETFLFILFLLCFAVAAAWYVWVEGTKDLSRNRYKLFIECTVILTSVIPQELPIELSLAVNSSLTALVKLMVFCTEPFRIPFAGKVDICCFDKTGTLTEDSVVVEGISGLNGEESGSLVPVKRCPLETVQVLATAHSLVATDSGLIVGDPLEKAMLEASTWHLSRDGVVFGKTVPRSQPLKIYRKFRFSSALRRMSVVCGHQVSHGVDLTYYACVKGSPEALKEMLVDAPLDYDDAYLSMARRGARVLALGWKDIGLQSHQQIRDLERGEVERGLRFVGFVIISCPLKKDSLGVVKELVESSHHVNMITGDNPLTACHVSALLGITRAALSEEEAQLHTNCPTLVLSPANTLHDDWHWQSVDDSVVLDAVTREAQSNLGKQMQSYDFCITGAGLSHLEAKHPSLLRALLPKIKVFARMAPKQKEQVVTKLRDLGYVTLMCGDGTNDVGALKQAHVGVSLINALGNPTSAGIGGKTPVPGDPSQQNVAQGLASSLQSRSSNSSGGSSHLSRVHRRRDELFRQALDAMPEDEHVASIGDASIAAPFTIKQASPIGVCHIVKQGRCTLVTTLQMFKILAVNALISAYSLSVLFLKGFKPAETQVVLQALLLTGAFFFISRSSPLSRLSRQRPMPNIFNVYTLATVSLQFAIHFYVLTTVVHAAEERMPPMEEGKFVDIHADFKPSILNTAVYLISTSMQATTFAVNYNGRPFMISLWENKPLLYALVGAFASILMLSSGIHAEAMQLLPMDWELRCLFYQLVLFDLVGSYVVDRLLSLLFGRVKAKRL